MSPAERLAEIIRRAEDESIRLDSLPIEKRTVYMPKECPWGVGIEECRRECKEARPVKQSNEKIMIVYDTQPCRREIVGAQLRSTCGLIGHEFTHTFENSIADKENQAAMLYLKKWMPNDGWIYITARKDHKNNPVGNGTGKSYAMEALVNRLCCEGIACKYIKVIDLTARLRRSYHGGIENEHDILRNLVEVPVLILDDIGKENLRKSGEVNEWAAEKLYYIIERRSRYEDRPIGFTSNFNLDELADRFGDNYGPAMASRIAGRCKGLDGKVRIWALGGPDRRL